MEKLKNLIEKPKIIYWNEVLHKGAKYQLSTIWCISVYLNIGRIMKMDFLVKMSKIGGGSVGNGPKCYFYPFWTDWNQSRHIPHTFSTFSHKILFLTHRGSLLAILDFTTSRFHQKFEYWKKLKNIVMSG